MLKCKYPAFSSVAIAAVLDLIQINNTVILDNVWLAKRGLSVLHLVLQQHFVQL
jgi:hypothetical protein